MLKMAAQMDEAMLVIQEASSAIGKVAEQLNGLEGRHKEVASTLNDLSNRIAQIEASQLKRAPAEKTKPPLYIKVSGAILL